MKNIQCPVGKRIRSNSSLRWRTKKRARGRRHEKKKGGRGLVERGKEGRGEDFEASAGLGKLTQIGWIVNAPSCAAASALRKISPPSAPASWVRHPLPLEVDNAISKYESARGMAKTCVYNAVLRGNVGRKEEEGKSFRGVFSYFILLFFGFSVFLFFFFFSRSRCKFLRLRFLLLLFSLFFFFRSLKKGFWGKRSRFVVIVDRVWLLYSIWAMILFFFGGGILIGWWRKE